jgi:PKD repeat protein
MDLSGVLQQESAGSSGNGDNGGGNGDGDNGSSTGEQNIQPIANASASERFAFVDTLVIFNGSLSSDSDGYITNWSWDLDDGSLGVGEIISQKYTSTGTYEVSLTVTDNKFATHTDSITVIITTANNAPTKPLLEGIIEGDQQTNYDYKIVSTDLDDDKIRYTVNWGDGNTNTSIFLSNGTYYLISHKWILAGIYTVTITATDNKTSIESTFTILIDVKYVDDLGYFIDENNDDIYDLFYSNESGKTTSVKQQEDGNYLIDINGDDKWDITYNTEAGSTSDYKESNGNGSPGLDVILMLFALIISIAIIVLRKKNNI